MATESEGSAVSRLLKSLEVPPPKSNAYAITQWVNADLIPMDSSRRTWNGWKYIVYWATGGRQACTTDIPCCQSTGGHSNAYAGDLGFAIYNYNTGSALIAYGLSAKQALAAGILSPIVLALMCVLCGVSLESTPDTHTTYRAASAPVWSCISTDTFLIFSSGLADPITLHIPWSVDSPGACAEAGSQSFSE